MTKQVFETTFCGRPLSVEIGQVAKFDGSMFMVIDNYVFDFIWDLYSATNCWYGDYSPARASTQFMYRYVPSAENNVSDITVREIKLVWSNASVFFQQGATIVVEGM